VIADSFAFRDYNASGDCRRVRDRLPAHAIRTLDDDATTEIDEHLLVCARCGAEHAELTALASLIALSAPTFDPPPELKRRIIAQTRLSATTPSPIPSLRAAAAYPRASAVTVSSPVERASRRWSRFADAYAVAPAIAVLMVLSLLTVSSQQQLSRERDRGDRLEQENAAIAAGLVLMQSAGGQNGNARWYPMLSVDELFAEAGGVVLGDPAQTTALLSVWNMPKSAGSYHVICETRFGDLLAAGELQVSDLGVGAITLNLPGPITEFHVVHIVRGGDLGDGSDPRVNDVLLVRLGDPTAVPEFE
jgi:hypothetical protein